MIGISACKKSRTFQEVEQQDKSNNGDKSYSPYFDFV
jgi:hypothetical protein